LAGSAAFLFASFLELAAGLLLVLLLLFAELTAVEDFLVEEVAALCTGCGLVTDLFVTVVAGLLAVCVDAALCTGCGLVTDLFVTVVAGLLAVCVDAALCTG